MEQEQDAKETASDTSVSSALMHKNSSDRLQLPVPKIEALDPLIRAQVVFDGDGIVMRLINDFIMDAVLGAREQFFRRRLMAFVSTCMTDRMFEAIIPTLDLPRSTDPTSVCENQDPIVQTLQRPADAIRGPSASFVDLHCQFEIPVVAVTPQKTKEAMITTPKPAKQDMSVSSLASYRVKRHANVSTAPPKEPQTLLDGHRPGIVFSTAPPPRISPRKAMTLLKSAHRLSAVPPQSKQTVSEDKPCDQIHTFQGSQSTSEDDHTSVSSAEQTSGMDQRRSRGCLESNTTWVQPQAPDFLGSGTGEGVITDDILTPIQIEFQVKRHRHRHHHYHQQQHHDPHAQVDSRHLPDLTPQRRLSNASSIGSELENHEPEFKNSLQFSRSSYHIDPTLSSPLSDSCDDSDDPSREREPHQLERMVLAAGVKLQTGEISKAGPELPVFPSRMRRATFFVRLPVCPLCYPAVLTYSMGSWKKTLYYL